MCSRGRTVSNKVWSSSELTSCKNGWLAKIGEILSLWSWAVIPFQGYFVSLVDRWKILMGSAEAEVLSDIGIRSDHMFQLLDKFRLNVWFYIAKDNFFSVSSTFNSWNVINPKVSVRTRLYDSPLKYMGKYRVDHSFGSYGKLTKNDLTVFW